jgi:hypothetical protein
VLVEEKDVWRNGQTVEEEVEGGIPKKAVLVLPDGQEIEYPDGGKEVSELPNPGPSGRRVLRAVLMLTTDFKGVAGGSW